MYNKYILSKFTCLFHIHDCSDCFLIPYDKIVSTRYHINVWCITYTNTCLERMVISSYQGYIIINSEEQGNIKATKSLSQIFLMKKIKLFCNYLSKATK